MGKKTDENDDFDPLESLSAPDDSEIHQDGAQKLEQSQLLQTLESEIAKLPVRQREAFLMRYWDELSITETAKAMLNASPAASGERNSRNSARSRFASIPERNMNMTALR